MPITSHIPPMNTKPNNSSDYLLLIIGVILTVLLLGSSCKPSAETHIKHYKKVAADISPVSETKKGILLGWVQANFPPQEIITEKEVIKKILDTSRYQFFRDYIAQLNEQLSIKNCPIINTDSLIEEAKKSIKGDSIIVYKTKEIKTKDTAGNWARDKKHLELQLEIAKAISQANDANDKLKEAITDKETAEHQSTKRLWWLIGSIVLLILSHYFRSKVKIPFL